MIRQRAQRYRMAALVIRAINEDPAHTHFAHLPECYFLAVAPHRMIKKRSQWNSNQKRSETAALIAPPQGLNSALG